MRDLAASMGISAPSLYNAFGDKQTLFARALERYLDCTARDRLRRLETSLPPKEAIHQFFAEIVDHSINDRERKGCFLVNSALEVAPHQRQLGAVIAKQFAEIEAFFKRCILAAQAMDRRHSVSMRMIRHASCSGCFSASAFLRARLPTARCLRGWRGPRWHCSVRRVKKAGKCDDRPALLAPQRATKSRPFLEENGVPHRIILFNLSHHDR